MSCFAGVSFLAAAVCTRASGLPVLAFAEVFGVPAADADFQSVVQSSAFVADAFAQDFEVAVPAVAAAFVGLLGVSAPSRSHECFAANDLF